LEFAPLLDSLDENVDAKSFKTANIKVLTKNSLSWVYGSVEFDTSEIGVWRVALGSNGAPVPETAQLLRFLPTMGPIQSIKDILQDAANDTVRIVIDHGRLSHALANFGSGHVGFQSIDGVGTHSLFVDGSL
jgi:hypothetical protein